MMVSKFAVPGSWLGFGLVGLLVAGCARISDKDAAARLDPDGDGVDFPNDCDDEDPNVGAGPTWFLDVDGDGYGGSDTVVGCTAEDGWVATSTDCDDADGDVHPGASETPYDGIDQDCAGGDDDDLDGDGFVGAEAGGDDCDDNSAEVNPSATEHYYDGIDQNCDGNDCDADEDGYSADPYGQGFCEDSDCIDDDASVYPDPSVAEIPYNGTDDNCDLSDADGDADGDGHWATDYYTQLLAAGVSAPDSTVGTVPTLDDCFDNLDTVPVDYVPVAGFGALAAADVYPGAADRPYDGVDADCAGDDANGNGVDDDFDWDGDSDPSSTWADRSGAVGGDCIDCPDECDGATGDMAMWCADSCADESDNVAGIAAAAVNSGVSYDAPYDGTDADCDGWNDFDVDRDFYVHVSYPAAAFGPWSTGDCDDDSSSVKPGASDVWYDGVDTDCGGEDDYDSDTDGYVADADSGLSTTYVGGSGALPAGDCDDSVSGVNPAASDVWYDGVDTDCGGEDDYDADLDGYVLSTYDGYPTTYVAGSGALPGDDCNDADADTFPGAAELESSTRCMTDADADGYGDDAAGLFVTSGADCDDSDAAVNPDAVDIFDGVDNECDGQADGLDVDDADAFIYGTGTYDYAGTGIWSVGDITGNGYDDLLIGGEMADNGGAYGSTVGEVWAFSGPLSVGAMPSVRDADLQIYGFSSQQRLGTDAVGVGDWDGDGYDDLLVTAPQTSSNATYDGMAMMYMGPLTGTMVGSSYTNKYYGTTSYQKFGTTASTGDLDGDGLVDLVVSAYGRDSYTGAAYVFGAGVSSAAASDADVAVISGPASGSYFGLAAESVGDVNGDGFDDLAVGAPYVAVTGPSAAGAVYIMHGPLSVTTAADADYIIAGSLTGGGLGNTLAAVGDVSGDGVDDVLASAPFATGTAGNYTGIVYVFEGNTTGSGAANDAWASYQGEVAGDQLGLSLSTQGDIDGDGSPDLLIGSETADQSASNTGVAYLVVGPVSGAQLISDVASGVFAGTSAGVGVGKSLHMADVDGDGADDVLTGAWADNTAASGAGGVYIFFNQY